MVIGTGGFILILVLLVVGFFLGFAAGIKYLLDKIRNVCWYEIYKDILDKLHTEANEGTTNS